MHELIKIIDKEMMENMYMDIFSLEEVSIVIASTWITRDMTEKCMNISQDIFRNQWIDHMNANMNVNVG